MRGENGDRSPELHIAVGNIPACAGKTTAMWISLPAWWEHPRVRGKTLELGDFFIRPEEHPRVRGENPT